MEFTIELSKVLNHYKRYKSIVPDYEAFLDYLAKPLPYSIRVNSLKIEPNRLAEKLEARGFKLKPVDWHPWFFLVESCGSTGQPGATLEHMLGYYYVQELVSAIPPILLDPKPGELVLDMAAAPGSKATQIAQMMENRGTLIANDVSRERIKALRFNIDRLGVTNTVVTLCDARRLRSSVSFDRILLDAPCSSEGIVRKDPTVVLRVSRRVIHGFSRLQKAMVKRAYSLLRDDGILVYSVCTFAPEECEEVVDYALTLGFTVEEAKIPLKSIGGIVEWVDEKGVKKRFNPEVEKALRIYPHLQDTGGMFVAKLRKI